MTLIERMVQSHALRLAEKVTLSLSNGERLVGYVDIQYPQGEYRPPDSLEPRLSENMGPRDAVVRVTHDESTVCYVLAKDVVSITRNLI